LTSAPDAIERLTGADEPWVAYSALLDLAGFARDSPEARTAYARLCQDPRVLELMDALADWPSRPLERAYDPKDALWKLGMLAEFLLTCWQRRGEPYRPVGFGIGSTFSKLQYPLVQYQVLKVVDTLSALPAVRGDPRLVEMLGEIERKRGADGLWTTEGVNKPYAAFDFGQKKTSSAWVSLLVLRAVRRVRGALQP
jgi:hypothetical protein